MNNDPQPTSSSGGRARDRAIRDRMASTGENWTTAARHHDAERAQAEEGVPEGHLPYRVVDRENQGWHVGGGNTTEPHYVADYGWERALPGRTHAELLTSRGPVRPVEPITDADSTRMRDRFATASRRTVTTLAAALHQTFVDIVTARLADTDATDADEAYAFARRTLVAGREGSWESEALMNLVWFGNDLNNGREMKSPKPAEPRWQPSTRVAPAVRDELAAILTRWITDPARYTEVASPSRSPGTPTTSSAPTGGKPSPTNGCSREHWPSTTSATATTCCTPAASISTPPCSEASVRTGRFDVEDRSGVNAIHDSATTAATRPRTTEGVVPETHRTVEVVGLLAGSAWCGSSGEQQGSKGVDDRGCGGQQDGDATDQNAGASNQAREVGQQGKDLGDGQAGAPADRTAASGAALGALGGHRSRAPS